MRTISNPTDSTRYPFTRQCLHTPCRYQICSRLGLVTPHRSFPTSWPWRELPSKFTFTQHIYLLIFTRGGFPCHSHLSHIPFVIHVCQAIPFVIYHTTSVISPFNTSNTISYNKKIHRIKAVPHYLMPLQAAPGPNQHPLPCTSHRATRRPPTLHSFLLEAHKWALVVNSSQVRPWGFSKDTRWGPSQH